MVIAPATTFDLKGWELILVCVYQNKDCYQSLIAKKIDMTFSYTCLMIAELERKGFLTKGNALRRKKEIKLTRKGKQLTEFILKIRELLK